MGEPEGNLASECFAPINAIFSGIAPGLGARALLDALRPTLLVAAVRQGREQGLGTFGPSLGRHATRAFRSWADRSISTASQLDARWTEADGRERGLIVDGLKAGLISDEAAVGAMVGAVLGPLGSTIGAVIGGMVAGGKVDAALQHAMELYLGEVDTWYDRMVADYNDSVPPAAMEDDREAAHPLGLPPHSGQPKSGVVIPGGLAVALVVIAIMGAVGVGGYVVYRSIRDVTPTATGPQNSAGGPSSAPTTVQLPAPFANLRLGLTEAELRAIYPTEGNIGSCSLRLLGPERVVGPAQPGGEGPARAACASEASAGGLTEDELLRAMRFGATLGGTEDDVAQAGDMFAGAWLTATQIRASVRAGAVQESVVFRAADNAGATAFDSVMGAAGHLALGTVVFALNSAGRYAIAATVDDRCEDLDPAKIRRFVEGGMGRSQIATEANRTGARCGYGITRQFPRFRGRLFSLSGGLAGIGLARAMRSDRIVDPERPETFRLFCQRARITNAGGRLATAIANAIPRVEDYWRGAVQLPKLPEAQAGPWGMPVVWLRDGKVTRILLNIWKGDKLAQLPAIVGATLGQPTSSQGTTTTWNLPGGAVAKLDIGAAGALVVESPTATSPLPVAQAPSTSPDGGNAPQTAVGAEHAEECDRACWSYRRCMREWGDSQTCAEDMTPLCRGCRSEGLGRGNSATTPAGTTAVSIPAPTAPPPPAPPPSVPPPAPRQLPPVQAAAPAQPAQPVARPPAPTPSARASTPSPPPAGRPMVPAKRPPVNRSAPAASPPTRAGDQDQQSPRPRRRGEVTADEFE